ncbi:MAG: YHS domain-containing protein [Planctomycetota bacterium]
MKKVFITGLVIAGLIAAWGCGKSADGPADRGKSEKPNTATEPNKPAQPAAATSNTVSATATAEVKLEVKSVVTSHTITDAEIGLKVKCPVMGSDIVVDKDTLSAEYKGKVYYFCCPGCPEEFNKNPEKYAIPDASATPPEK